MVYLKYMLFAGPEILTTSKGYQRLHINGYFYIKDRFNNDKQYWKCAKFHRSCKARCITTIHEDGAIYQFDRGSENHNHEKGFLQY